MDMQKVDLFIATNSSKFPPERLGMIREKLMVMDDSKFIIIQCLDYKDPTTTLLLSIFLGYWGVDRFYIGDIGLGLGKLFTWGGCYVWYFIDIFFVMARAREINFVKLMSIN